LTPFRWILNSLLCIAVLRLTLTRRNFKMREKRRIFDSTPVVVGKWAGNAKLSDLMEFRKLFSMWFSLSHSLTLFSFSYLASVVLSSAVERQSIIDWDELSLSFKIPIDLICLQSTIYLRLFFGIDNFFLLLLILLPIHSSMHNSFRYIFSVD
jgi:hypothetical protein